jgi:hypothetical protein
MSIRVFLRVLKHDMHYNNENKFGIYLFIYPTAVWPKTPRHIDA